MLERLVVHLVDLGLLVLSIALVTSFLLIFRKFFGEHSMIALATIATWSSLRAIFRYEGGSEVVAIILIQTFMSTLAIVIFFAVGKKLPLGETSLSDEKEG